MCDDSGENVLEWFEWPSLLKFNKQNYFNETLQWSLAISKFVLKHKINLNFKSTRMLRFISIKRAFRRWLPSSSLEFLKSEVLWFGTTI